MIIYNNNNCAIYVNIEHVKKNETPPNPPSTPEVFEQQNTTRQTLYVNQCGYDSDKSKRFTATNIRSGTEFNLKKKDTDEIVYTGSINNQIGDFSDFTNNTDEEFYIECNTKKSYSFKIKDNYIQNLSFPLALKFMEMSRQDTFDVGGSTGYAWRDGHQFSFELNSLVMMYMSNPSYFENLPRDVYKVNECEYTELQVQNEPNIIWLIKFGVMRYYKWATENDVQLHAMIKGQLAYFLYLYPHITDYVTQEFYEQIRDFTIQQWTVATCNKEWYNETPQHNLLDTESTIGTTKGANPPGYSIVPNLLMYEVCKRDGLDYNAYLTSAYNTCKWIVDEVDFNIPLNTKGQRMNEYITITSLAYFYEMYPTLCPDGLYNKLYNLSQLYISRSNNMWDFRQYQTEGDLSGANSTIWTNDATVGTGICNEPGNIAGFPAVAYSLIRVIEDADICKRLKELAVSHIDNMFGRNPTGRHFCYAAVDEFDGADFSWIERYQGGYGNLGYCIGVLDGSPKEANYPYDPYGDTGYTEGWVAFNTAWNTSLAYLEGEKHIGIDIFAK